MLWAVDFFAEKINRPQHFLQDLVLSLLINAPILIATNRDGQEMFR
jgi:hypothetical protein